MYYVNYLLDEERWRDIIDVRIKDVYQVSDRGRIKNKSTGYILRPILGADGYYHVNLQRKNSYKSNCRRRINRLVLIAFNPIDNAHELVSDHRDGNKLRNILTNLKWSTQKQNLERAKSLNLLNIPKGENHPKAIHSDEDASRICVLLKQNHSIDEILEKLNWDNTRNNRMFIRDIRNLKIYTHISNTYKLPIHNPEKIPLIEKDVRRICELLEEGRNYSYIINDLGLEYNNNIVATISSIKRGKSFINITNEYSFDKSPEYIRRDDGYVHQICKKLKEGKSSNDILNELNIPKTKIELHFISKVRNGLSFRNISSEYNII
jgi:hypothetical protein